MKLSTIRLGQTWWPGEGREAVEMYDSLVARVPLIADADARGEILKWVGRSDVPGSPAERYKVVANALSSQVPVDDVLRERVNQLKAVNAELSAQVSLAEEAYGMLSAAAAAGSTPEADTGGLCLAGGTALLGLVVIPLILS